MSLAKTASLSLTERICDLRCQMALKIDKETTHQMGGKCSRVSVHYGVLSCVEPHWKLKWLKAPFRFAVIASTWLFTLYGGYQ